MRGVVARLRVGDLLLLARDFDSAVNRNAVQMTKGGEVIGYLPWAASQAVAPELDVGTELIGSVTRLVTSPAGVSVEVQIARGAAQPE